MKDRVINYIRACQIEDDTAEMDKALFAFTEADLKIMSGGKIPRLEEYKDTANPEWCLRFDCVNRWIYKMLDWRIKHDIRTEETELFFWYWFNI